MNINKKIKGKISDKKFLLLLILLQIIIFTVLLSTSKFIMWDEAVYLSNARSHISESNYTEEFRFPLLEFMVAFAWIFTGENLLSARLLIIFFSLISTILFFNISKILLKHYRFSTIVFVLNPLLYFWGFRVYADIPMLAFILAGVYFALKNKIFLAGIFAGLSFMTRFPAILCFIPLGILLLYKKQWKKVLFFICGFIISNLPLMIYNFLKYDNPLFQLLWQYSYIGAWTTWQPIYLFLLNLLVWTGILIFFSIGGVFYSFKLKKLRLISWIFIINLVYYTFFVNLKLQRYILVILPFMIILATFFIEIINRKTKELNVKKKRRNNILFHSRIFKNLLIINIMLILIIGSFNICHHLNKENSNLTINTINFLEKNYNKEDVIISENHVYYGYFLNAKAYSLYDSKDIVLSNLKQFNQNNYFLVLGESFNLIEDENLIKTIKINNSEDNLIRIYKGKFFSENENLK